MSAETVIKLLLDTHRAERMSSKSIRVPLGSNDVKYNTWYYGTRVSGPAFMWCAVYQSWVMAMAGVPMSIYPMAASVPVVRDFFKERGRLFQTPMVGDLVIFIFSATERHIGFVETLEGDGRFNSIEGNVSDRVMRVPHRRGDPGIVGYGRPDYNKVEVDVTKEELIDVLRSGFTPGEEITRVSEWAGQLNQVKKDVAEIKQMLQEMRP
jgi:hypothetical protein